MSGTLFADPGGEFYYSLGNPVAPLGMWSSSDNTFGGNWSLVNNAPTGRQAASDGKVYALSTPGGALGATCVKLLPNNYGRLIVGVAFYSNTAVWGNNRQFISFSSGGTVQADIRTTNTSGNVSFSRNGTLYGSPSTITLAAGWHYYEVDITFSTSTTGVATFKMDGLTVLTVSGVQSSNSSTCNQITIYNATNLAGYWKDIYMTDGTVGPFGDITVNVKYPNGAGVNSAWTANTGTALAAVQDGITHTGTWPDGDITYIASSNPNDISDFTHETLSGTGQIKSVIHVSYLRKDDAGNRSVSQACLSSGTTELSSTIALGNSDTYYMDPLDVDPHTGSAWTISGYNAATFGSKLIS